MVSPKDPGAGNGISVKGKPWVPGYFGESHVLESCAEYALNV